MILRCHDFVWFVCSHWPIDWAAVFEQWNVQIYSDSAQAVERLRGDTAFQWILEFAVSKLRDSGGEKKQILHSSHQSCTCTFGGNLHMRGRCEPAKHAESCRQFYPPCHWYFSFVKICEKKIFFYLIDLARHPIESAGKNLGTRIEQIGILSNSYAELLSDFKRL